MDGTLVLVLIGIAVAITYFAMRSEMNQQSKRWKEERKLLERRVDAYDKYLTKNCNYERPFRRYNGDWLVRDPMTDEYKYHMFMGECSEYEAEHKNAQVDGCVNIDGALYDLRESKYNELAIENYENKEKCLITGLEPFYANGFMLRWKKNIRKTLKRLGRRLQSD